MFLPFDADYLMRRQCDAVAELVGAHLQGPKARCADLGCSRGDALPHLERTFDRVVGVDIDRGHLREGRAKLGSSARFVLTGGWGDEAITYPFASGAFDAVTSFSLLHHLDDARRAQVVAEAARLVRPGGLVVFFEYNPLNPLALATMAFGPEDEGSRPMFPSTVRALFETCGLSPVQSGHVLVFPRSLRALAPLEDRLRRAPIGAKHFVAGLKT